MIRQRLFLQIYLTILAALALTVLVTSIMFSRLGPEDRPSETAVVLAQRAIAQALPPVGATDAEQAAVLERIGADLGIELALFGAAGNRIAAHGTQTDDWGAAQPEHQDALRLPDGRVIMARIPFPRRGGASALGVVLGATALAIAVAAYPFVRRLTGRLERLQGAVERIGDGDLSTRASVEGRDEIAALAGSFNHAADRIEALVEAHRVLLANASHELRTPLSRIRVGLSMFRETQDPERLANIDTDITQLDTLIDELLTLSRLEAAPVAMEPDIDFLGLVAEECAQFGVAVDGAPARIQGNRDLLRRLVRNLVSNAQRHGKPPVSVEVNLVGAKPRLVVRDAGDGIPVGEREKVFERFYRGAGKQDIEGYGLGLPLVRQIAEAHAGQVRLAGNGHSEIVVEFPGPV